MKHTVNPTVYNYEFSDQEIKDILINHLKSKGISIPKGRVDFMYWSEYYRDAYGKLTIVEPRS